MLKCFMRAALRFSESMSAPQASYGTWNLSPYAHINAGRIQPVLEVDKVISLASEYAESIEKRKLTQNFSVGRLTELYDKAKNLKAQIRNAEKLKEENSKKVQTLLKTVGADAVNGDEIKKLRETGKNLREELRHSNNSFNTVNDELVELILSLPNTLDPVTPVDQAKKLREVFPNPGLRRWTKPNNLHWENIPKVGPCPDYVRGSGAWAELELAEKSQKRLVLNGYCETGNVDFVKRILLEGSGLDPDQFLRIREAKLRPAGMASSTYLVGGASFPAFLALFAQTLLQHDDVLPLRYFVVGRYYEKEGGNTIQKSNVQVVVACRDVVEQEQEFHRLAELMEKFYSEDIGLSFQTNLLPAPQLRTYEKKKLSFVAKDDESQVVGDLATVGDYVSKRLLCCYIDPERAPKFLHLITGQFLNITDYLRPKSSLVKPGAAGPKISETVSEPTLPTKQA